MISILFMVVQFFATLFLFFAMLGSIRINKVEVNGGLIPSMLIHFAFIFIAVAISLSHPGFFLLYGVITVASMLWYFRPAAGGVGYGLLFGLTTFAFWPQVVAMCIFSLMHVPKDADEADD